MNLKQSKGITLIALVITIIVMLLLAGISIQAITNTGIFEKASQAKKEAERSQIVEWLNLKLIEEQTYNPLGTSEQIIEATRQNVNNNKSKLEKMGETVTVENTSTVENGKQVDIYFYVKVDEDTYKVDIRGAKYISENITNIDTTAPSSFTITNTAVGVNSFTLSATFEDNESGLGKIILYYKKPEDTTWQLEEVVYTEITGSITESITKTYSVENMTQGGEVQAYAVGYDVAGNSITTTNADENNPLTFNTETYTISYDAKGGEGAPEIQTKYYGVDIQLSSTKPTKSGYIFLGWSEDSTATSVNYAAGATYSSNSNATLYAVWKTVQVSGTINVTVTHSVTVGNKFTQDVNGVTWYGYYVHGSYSSGSTTIEGKATTATGSSDLGTISCSYNSSTNQTTISWAGTSGTWQNASPNGYPSVSSYSEQVSYTISYE